MNRIFTDIIDFGDNDEVEEDNEEGSTGKFKKFDNNIKAIVYLIDATEKSYLTSFENKSEFIKSLECVRKAIRNKIFNKEKCYCSIVLLGTKKSDNVLNLQNLTVIQEFKLLGALHVLKIDEIIKAVENSSYRNDYGFDKYSLADAFWLSTHILNQRSKKTFKSIILLTGEDSPVRDNKNEYNRITTAAKDLYKNSILFELVPIGKDFDVTLVYQKLIQSTQNDVNCIIPDPVCDFDTMAKRVSKTSYNHVSMSKLTFEIGQDFQIGVSFHFLVRKVKIPFKIKLTKSNNERVVTKMQMFEVESGSLIKSDSTIKSQVFGKKDVNFTPSELKAITDFGKPGLKLLGFKPASAISLENFVKPCAFIYPDDKSYKGSSVFFTALLRRCIAKQVVPICTLCLRSSSSCRFVALIGQNGTPSEGKIGDLPQGFVVFFLPFAEEIRSFDDVPSKRADEDQVIIAEKFMKKLRFNYKVESFQNPRIRTHWAAIEALALDLSEAEEVGDSTYPNYALMSQRAGGIAEEFMDAVYPKGYDPELSGAPKKAKPVNAEPEICPESVAEIIKEGKGNSLSNDILKAFLKSIGKGKGLSKMKKTDLLEEAQKYVK